MSPASASQGTRRRAASRRCARAGLEEQQRAEEDETLN
jgi:hypothetical protein